MKAIVNTGPNQLELLELPMPEPGSGQVRIRTSACGICATELAMIAGWKRTGFPSIPGHEWSGRIDAVGPDVDQTLIDKNCVAENVLADGSEVGFEHPGGYAEYFLTEAANVYTLPDDFPMIMAALMEPLAVSIRGRRKLPPEICDPVLIFGDGSIGLLSLMLALREGIEVILVGGSRRKLDLAMEIGASSVFDYHTADSSLKDTIMRKFGMSFPTIIEASGSVIAAEAALDLVSQCGKILILSDYGDDVRSRFIWNDLLHREFELIGSNASAGAWQEAVQLAVCGELPLDCLITHRFSAMEFDKAFDIMRTRRQDAVKVILEWV